VAAEHFWAFPFSVPPTRWDLKNLAIRPEEVLRCGTLPRLGDRTVMPAAKNTGAGISGNGSKTHPAAFAPQSGGKRRRQCLVRS
jgi:hypothetical protein